MKPIKASSYFIHFNKNAYLKLNLLIKKKQYSSIFILVDENTIKCCYPIFMNFFLKDKKVNIIEINSGERYKNLDTCNNLWKSISDIGGDRKSVLINLGGGVITDLGGFVASSFKRGIDFINIPTTLLSMVDASVGGKTGIDLGVLKNQIGFFSNPEMVIIDTEYLKTLSLREIRSGLAEIIKYGLTFDYKIYKKIIKNNKLNFLELIYRSIEIKNKLVLKDPKEKNIRKVLNFGHTIGHAVESYFLQSNEKKTLTHGEAIAIGIICESYISTKIFNLSIEKSIEIKNNIINIFGKSKINENDFKPILNFLKHDKKNINKELNFVLLNKIEDFKIDNNVDKNLIIDSLCFYNN